MVKIITVTFFVLLEIFGVSALNVQFLKSVSRFTSPITDYYFCCNVKGLTLIWEVNGFGLGGFEEGQTAMVHSSSKGNFNYIATLLSSRLESQGQFTFDSVLIVSLPDNSSTLNVTCRSDSASESTSNHDEPQEKYNEPLRNHSHIIYLERIFTGIIVHNYELENTSISASTSIFVCGVQNLFQTWQASRQPYGFDVDDRVGLNRDILSSDGATVNEQAIYLAKQPYEIVTVFLVTNHSNVTVRCASGAEERQLSMQIPLSNKENKFSNTATIKAPVGR